MTRKLPDTVRPGSESTAFGGEFRQDVINHMNSPENRTVWVDPNHPEAFTRNRKLPLETMGMTLIYSEGKTSYSNLMNYYSKTDKPFEERASDTAWQKRRESLNPRGFNSSLVYATSMFFNRHRDQICTYHGYTPLGIDSSVTWVPRNEETEKVFGTAKDEPDFDDPCLARVSGCFASFNKLFLHTAIGSYRSSERVLARKNIITVLTMYPIFMFLFIFDRGYYGRNFMDFLYQNNVPFLFKLKKGILQEYVDQVPPGEQKEFYIALPIDIPDEEQDIDDIDLDFDVWEKDQKKPKTHRVIKGFHLTISKPFKDNPSISKKIEDDDDEDIVDGCYVFLTNIPAKRSSRVSDFPALDAQETSEIYRTGRWPIETAFGELKNDFMWEDFIGESPKFIRQELFATLLLYNMTSLEAQTAIDKYPIEEEEGSAPKKPNFRRAAAKIKSDLLKAASHPDPEVRAQLMMDIHMEIAKNLTTVRESPYGRRKTKIVVKGRNKKRKP